MKISSFFSLLLLIFGFYGKCQVSLSVQELPVDNFKNYVPDNQESLNYEIRYPGHLLEITIRNESNNSVSFPLDSASYALPYTDDTREYYRGVDNIIPNPDLYNISGVFAFVYQKGDFKTSDLGTDPFYEEIQWQEIRKIEKLRLEKIHQWMADKNISDELSATYNGYLMNHMITLPAHKSIKYKIYFNPFLKMLKKYSRREYYFRLDPKISCEVVFRLILNKNLYKFLTKEDRRKYPDLFTGVVSSNHLVFKAL